MTSDNWCQRRAAVEHGKVVRHGQIGHRRPRFPRRAAEMRREDNVLEIEEPGEDLGLTLVDIERRAGNQAFLERPRQAFFVDDGPARGVDEKRRPLHARERAPIDHVTRRRRQRRVNRDDIRRNQQFVERHLRQIS